MFSFEGRLKASIDLVREVFIVVVVSQIPEVGDLLFPDLHVRLVLFDNLLALRPGHGDLHQEVSLLGVEGLASLLALGALVELDGEAGVDEPSVERRSLVQQHDGELLELALSDGCQDGVTDANELVPSN